MYLVTASTPARRGTMILFVRDLHSARRQAASLMRLIAKLEGIPFEDLTHISLTRWQHMLSGLQAYDPRIAVSVGQTQLDPAQFGVPVLEQPKRFPRWSSNKNVALGRALRIPVRW